MKCVICKRTAAQTWCTECQLSWDRRRLRDDGTILAAMVWAADRAAALGSEPAGGEAKASRVALGGPVSRSVRPEVSFDEPPDISALRAAVVEAAKAWADSWQGSRSGIRADGVLAGAVEELTAAESARGEKPR